MSFLMLKRSNKKGFVLGFFQSDLITLTQPLRLKHMESKCYRAAGLVNNWCNHSRDVLSIFTKFFLLKGKLSGHDGPDGAVRGFTAASCGFTSEHRSLDSHGAPPSWPGSAATAPVSAQSGPIFILCLSSPQPKHFMAAEETNSK